MLKKPENQQIIAELIGRLNEAQAAFQQAFDAYQTLQDNKRTLQAAAKASEADAQNARSGLRAMLRETLGRPTKQLQQHSAAHRSAIELAEEYNSIAADLDAEIAQAQVAASNAASLVNDQKRTLKDTYARRLMAEAVAEVAPRLRVALEIQARAALSTPFNPMLAAYGGDENALVEAGLLNALQAAMRNTDAQSAGLPDDIQEALQNDNTHGFKTLTPLQSQKLLNSVKNKEAA